MPSHSRKQQRYFGMLYAKAREGDMTGLSDKDKQVVSSMGIKKMREYAKTKHKGLPDKVAFLGKLVGMATKYAPKVTATLGRMGSWAGAHKKAIGGAVTVGAGASGTLGSATGANIGRASSFGGARAFSSGMPKMQKVPTAPQLKMPQMPTVQPVQSIPKIGGITMSNMEKIASIYARNKLANVNLSAELLKEANAFGRFLGRAFNTKNYRLGLIPDAAGTAAATAGTAATTPAVTKVVKKGLGWKGGIGLLGLGLAGGAVLGGMGGKKEPTMPPRTMY